MILPYRKIWPKIHETVFIAPSADIIGDVEITYEEICTSPDPSPTPTPTITPTRTQTPTPTQIICGYGLTTGDYYYTDCCDNFIQGSNTGISVIFNYTKPSINDMGLFTFIAYIHHYVNPLILSQMNFYSYCNQYIESTNIKTSLINQHKSFTKKSQYLNKKK